MKKLIIIILKYKLYRAVNSAKRESDPIAKITKLLKIKDLEKALKQFKNK